MIDYIIIEIIVLMVYIAHLVKEYTAREVPTYVIVLVYISWLLSFGIVTILPLDIYYVQYFLKI